MIGSQEGDLSRLYSTPISPWKDSEADTAKFACTLPSALSTKSILGTITTAPKDIGANCMEPREISSL